MQVSQNVNMHAALENFSGDPDSHGEAGRECHRDAPVCVNAAVFPSVLEVAKCQTRWPILLFCFISAQSKASAAYYILSLPFSASSGSRSWVVLSPNLVVQVSCCPNVILTIDGKFDKGFCLCVVVVGGETEKGWEIRRSKWFVTFISQLSKMKLNSYANEVKSERPSSFQRAEEEERRAMDGKMTSIVERDCRCWVQLSHAGLCTQGVSCEVCHPLQVIMQVNY